MPEPGNNSTASTLKKAQMSGDKSIDVTVQFAATPHPSIMLVDREWSDDADIKGEKPLKGAAYLKLMNEQSELIGVLQIVDYGSRAPNKIYIDPRAWLKNRPEIGQTIKIQKSDKTAFIEWRSKHTKYSRLAFWTSVVFGVVAGLIELSWGIGKHTPLWVPPSLVAAISEVLKWGLVGVGVLGITKFKEYRSIE